MGRCGHLYAGLEAGMGVDFRADQRYLSQVERLNRQGFCAFSEEDALFPERLYLVVCQHYLGSYADPFLAFVDTNLAGLPADRPVFSYIWIHPFFGALPAGSEAPERRSDEGDLDR